MCSFKIWDERCGLVMDDTKSLLVTESRREGGGFIQVGNMYKDMY